MKQTIKKCLDSLINLDYPCDCYEIVVVDGGSTDGTQEIVQNYNVKMVIDKSRTRGIARNMGIKHSKGEIVAFTDADCEVDNKWLTYHALEHVKDSRVGAVGGSITHPYLKGNLLVNRVIQDGEYSKSSPRRYMSYITTINGSFKRKALIDAGFFERLHIGEDTELCSRVLMKGYRILFNPKAEVIHRHFVGVGFDNPRIDFSSFVAIYSKGGKVHFNMQFVGKDLVKYRLPMSPYIIVLLLPGITMLRIIRYLHKMKYADHKLELIRNVHYIFLAALCWICGYVSELKKNRSMLR